MGTGELALIGLAGSGLGTVVGVPMVWPRARPAREIRLMGGWVLALSAIAGLISARVLGLLPASPVTNHAINVLGLLAYPLVYLHVREQTRPLSSSRRVGLWVPALAYALWLAGRAGTGSSTQVPFVVLLPVLLAFTTLCAVEVVRHGPRLVGKVVPAWQLVGMLAAINVAQVVRLMFGDVPLVPAIVPLMMAAVIVSLVATIVWRAMASAPAAAVVDSPRYERSSLDDTEARALLARVQAALESDRRFADPDLDLPHLAAAVGATTHQVSECLNRVAGLSFHDLLARRRVADVKAQLLAPTAGGFTIQGIGATAGFGSRSALYAAFRRLEGMTPAQFRQRAASGYTGEDGPRDRPV